MPLSEDLVGTWELVSREDRNAAGERRVDPALGADPIGVLTYDRGGRFAAQFMKRDRSASAPVAAARAPGANNSRAVGGYDAYFGVYSVDDATGAVTQTLLGALSPENVGMRLTRGMNVVDDTLTIELATTSVEGEPITRTLLWRRIA